MVIANELLDNLPFDVYARDGSGWTEVRVGETAAGFGEIEIPADPGVAGHLSLLAPDAAPGSRVPWQAAAADWLRRALEIVERGEVIVIDYARPTAELAGAGDWLRTYRSGGRGREPLQDIGEQDITVDLALDQLELVRRPDLVEDQRAWLERHGLGELESAAASEWRAGAATPDLLGLRARSRLGEAAALRDPSGLGGFTVCHWSR
jgi:SAM-dependent MidA family methyltransferase